MNLFVGPIRSTHNQKSETKQGDWRQKAGATTFEGFIRAVQREHESGNGQARQDGFQRSPKAAEEAEHASDQAFVIRPPIQTVDHTNILMLLSQRV